MMKSLFTTVFLLLVLWIWVEVEFGPMKRSDNDGRAIFEGQYDPPPMPPPPHVEFDYDESEEDEDDDDDGYDERSVHEAHKYVREVSTSYNYSEVLEKSLMFYEAQRSGDLPASNRISYRGDSALDDSGFSGENLTGGYYDTGDHVKFGLPMAFTSTVLTWGLIRFKDAYVAAGQLENMYETVKWATDYFIKGHVSPQEFYHQVGDGDTDHAYWGPPESMTMPRPPIVVNTTNPGSEVAAEAAAALAAASIAFDGVTEYPGYSAECLEHAIQLFDLANDYRGNYDAGGYYASSNYGDELCWAASWLYYATGDVNNLTTAEALYETYCKPRGWAFAWGNKNAGAQALLYQLTGAYQYQKKITDTVDRWMPNMSLPYTPQGLVFRDSWGPLRYAAGTTMIALLGADMDVNKDVYIDWAKGQIHYMLGDTGRSFVVGFGTNAPQRPHHRASSCNSTLTGNEALTSPDPNPNILVGALVGGPDINDYYDDNRQNYVANAVGCEYNAAFQTSIAGLLHFELEAQRKK